ncbi:MAG: sugar transferase [Ilumatobacteraceae bacterium]|nr:sugar transferase [Ilumatobacteraceae bacterium]
MSGRPSPGPSSWIRVRSLLLDRLVALVLLPVLAPIIAVLGWRVRRGDGGPPLIGLDRSGRGGGTFAMWKLRSMRADDPSGAARGSTITATDDDRITPVGAMMRRWRLDELPQVWNVLRGDMAVFGPRPETPAMVDLDDERWQAVLAAKPGITGPTQLLVERWEATTLAQGSAAEAYRAVILPVKLAVDRWYVEQGTPVTDVQVVCSMLQRFVLGREETWVERTVRRDVPEAAQVPVGGAR